MGAECICSVVEHSVTNEKAAVPSHPIAVCCRNGGGDLAEEIEPERTSAQRAEGPPVPMGRSTRLLPVRLRGPWLAPVPFGRRMQDGGRGLRNDRQPVTVHCGAFPLGRAESYQGRRLSGDDAQ